MIKVNLLRDRTARVRRAVVAPSFSRMGFLLAALFLIFIVVMWAWWHSLGTQIRELTESRDRLRIENTRLQALRKEITEYEKMKQLQESRIQVIEDLKNNQTGPVRLLNSVIRSVPQSSSLWLTDLDQKGDHIQIKGYTLHGEAIPDIMTELAATGYFKSVDLELLEQEKEGMRFSLICISKQKVVTE